MHRSNRHRASRAGLAIRTALTLLAPLALLPIAPAPAHAAPSRAWVIVLANNRSVTPGVAPLRYADDDGARWYELLRPLAARAALLTVLDDETQRLFPGLAAHATPPTRAALDARLGAFNREIAAARAAGAETTLYLVIVGHGEIGPDGEGFVSLLDGPLRRAQLLREVLAASRADFTHLVIDACNAWLLVARRGADDSGPSGADAVRRYLADEDLARLPGTGVLLSTSRARATHEWSVFGGGVFSHQVRSALAGAADVNGDGRVEYSEVAAYIAAANLRIDDPRGRLDVFVLPPARDHHRALVDLGAGAFDHFVRVPAEARGHFYLEDGRGVRYGDFHAAGERPVVLALVPSSHYWLRGDRGELRLPWGPPGTLEVRPEWLVPRALAARGAIEESFAHLFESPFGPSFYRGFVASAGQVAVTDPPPRPFVPPAVRPALDRDDLRARLAALADRRRDGAPEDPYADALVRWASRRLDDADLREAARAIAELERHAQSQDR